MKTMVIVGAEPGLGLSLAKRFGEKIIMFFLVQVDMLNKLPSHFESSKVIIT